MGTHPAKNLLVLGSRQRLLRGVGMVSDRHRSRGVDLGHNPHIRFKNVKVANEPGDLLTALDDCLAKDELSFLKANVESGPLPKAFEPLPFDGLDGTYRFRQALVDEGLVDTWTDVTPVHYTFKK